MEFTLNLKLAFLLLLPMSIMLFSPQQSDAADFNAFGGAAIGENAYSVSGPKSGLGFGTQVTVGVGDLVGLEFGVIYLGEASSYGSGLTSSSITQNYLDVPVMLRISPLPHLSLMAGGYYGWGLGVDHFYAVNGTASSASSRGKNDYGEIVGVSLQFPFNDKMKLRIESTY
jgi:hypothetical protein